MSSHAVRKKYQHVERMINLHYLRGGTDSTSCCTTGSVRLEFAERDQWVSASSVGPNDPEWSKQWAMQQIQLLDAWSRLTELGLDGQEITVAVIDTGVQLDHPDLNDSLWTNTGEIPNNGIDDDGNGFVDDVHGYDFAGGSLSMLTFTLHLTASQNASGEDGDPNDDNGHGTHCATQQHI